MNLKPKTIILFCSVLVLVSACAASSGTNNSGANNSSDASQVNGEDTITETDSQTDTSDEMSPDDTDTNSTDSNDIDTNGTDISDAEDNPVLLESEYPGDPGEILRTWNAALVKFPDGNGGVIKGTIKELEDGTLTSDQQLPVVIYLHGCSGFFSGSDFRMDWLASQGFISIAPNSFARSFYPESCSLSSRQGWLYKPTIEMRHNDAAFAIEQVRSFPWADQDNVFIYGFSEGGVIAATLNSTNPLQQVNARVVESWNCITIPWSEYTGISVPESEPVLTLFADQDPWLQGQALSQNCGNFISQTNGSQSVLIDFAPLNTEHTLLEAPQIQEIVLNFLLQQLSAL